MQLHEWTLPIKQCVHSGNQRYLIPASTWQVAASVYRATLTNSPMTGEHNGREWLRVSTREEQPTEWVWAKLSRRRRWETIDNQSVQQSVGVRRVEVLRDIDWAHMEKQVTKELTVRHLGEDIRRSLLLRACPYLQHLYVAFDSRHYAEPTLDDIFAAVLHLPTLHLDEYSWNDSSWKRHTVKPDRLPQLTSLRCTNLSSFGVLTILDIASHSTLDEVRIASGTWSLEEISG